MARIKAEDRLKHIRELKDQLATAQAREAELVAYVERMREALYQQTFWLEGALNCKEWSWCPDQREAAEGSVAYAKEVRAATPAQSLADAAIAKGEK